MLPKAILVPVDFTDHSDRATRLALEFAQSFGARVCLLHAYTVPFYPPLEGAGPVWTGHEQLAAELRTKLNELVASAHQPGVTVDSVLKEGDPRDAVLSVISERHIDLVVMGTHGRRGVSRALLGSVAESVVRTASCPVLTVH